eukprot:TRINITY_DN8908_c0_g1_i4.p1 TRINITY_DN8908_c0_g1~~TRINITY_DN8908_c0_g1_i4.p1  ORF type:complete len:374 (+),score=22.67 TRINITY_DN8908_c0_g1_i4:150-1271(+)
MQTVSHSYVNMSTISIGIPGNLIDSTCETSYSVTKVGGQFWLPQQMINQISFEQYICCHQQMIPIFQTFVPQKGQQRILLILGCMKCSQGLKAIRLQWDFQSSKHNSNNLKTTNNFQKLQSQGLQLQTQTNNTNGDIKNEDGIDLSSLSSQLDKLLTLKRSQSQSATQKQQSKEQTLVENTARTVELQSKSKLPSFYVHAIKEPQKDQLNETEKCHIDQLLQQYQQSDKEVNENEDDRANSGEKYEKQKFDKVNQNMIKYIKRVNRCQQQCARYGFGGECLWPIQFQMNQIPKCECCGGDRVFEVQLMSPLIACLNECCEWLSEDEQSIDEIGVARQAIENWQWLSVACFTCGQSCWKQEQNFYEEHIMVFNE